MWTKIITPAGALYLLDRKYVPAYFPTFPTEVRSAQFQCTSSYDYRHGQGWVMESSPAKLTATLDYKGVRLSLLLFDDQKLEELVRKKKTAVSSMPSKTAQLDQGLAELQKAGYREWRAFQRKTSGVNVADPHRLPEPEEIRAVQPLLDQIIESLDLDLDPPFRDKTYYRKLIREM